MATNSKRIEDALKKFDRNTLYAPREALEKLKETASAKFDETVELTVRLGVNPRHADQQVRGAVALPHGTGKEVRVLVFAKGDKAKEAEQAGADHVGQEELADKVEGGWMDFDIAVATPDMMGVVGKLGRILGPRGMMPNPKTGTVTMDVGRAVSEIKAGKIEYRTEKAGIIHVPIGKASFEVDQLLGNFKTVIDTLVKAKPAAAKGQYLRSVTISSTMGPGIKVHPQQAAAADKE